MGSLKLKQVLKGRDLKMQRHLCSIPLAISKTPSDKSFIHIREVTFGERGASSDFTVCTIDAAKFVSSLECVL